MGKPPSAGGCTRHHGLIPPMPPRQRAVAFMPSTGMNSCRSRARCEPCRKIPCSAACSTRLGGLQGDIRWRVMRTERGGVHSWSMKHGGGSRPHCYPIGPISCGSAPLHPPRPTSPRLPPHSPLSPPVPDRAPPGPPVVTPPPNYSPGRAPSRALEAHTSRVLSCAQPVSQCGRSLEATPQ